MQAALDVIEDAKSSNSEIDLVIIPPDLGNQTDNEEFDDDDLVFTEMPKDDPGEIEVDINGPSEDKNNPNYSDEWDEDDDILLSELLIKKANQRQKMTEPKWTRRPVDMNINGTNGTDVRLENVRGELSGLNAVQIFKKLFDEEVVDHIVTQTNIYAATDTNNHHFNITNEEMKIFIGLLLLTGYHRLPHERFYWSLDEDVGISFVSNALNRNRFTEIKKYIHLADKSNLDKLDKNDKIYKIRKFMNLINTKFQQWGIIHEHLSIDEAMVKYFGYHSATQFIRGKPVRFGYKDWMMCSSTGYCYAFDTYCGAKPSAA
ncbi:hypothetical protein NQ314_004770 [Rhamnusium bicolor]|uniref:PiggyBac transposable element-derived protein domain-containing protein n=1 Tax=Rhamnusium bicolor TaxID=1586634 RepID=A0AAV8ZK72_9CUCU|nr:hypothetical protein NQ314_004770 [Rhamnusium bicolor]